MSKSFIFRHKPEKRSLQFPNKFGHKDLYQCLLSSDQAIWNFRKLNKLYWHFEGKFLGKKGFWRFQVPGSKSNGMEISFTGINSWEQLGTPREFILFFFNKKEETLFVIKLNLKAVQSHLSIPWVPETLLARFSAFGQHRKYPLHARKNSG